jgi:hypothetical protein
MVVAASAGLGVEVLGPGVPVAGAVSQRAEWGAQPPVAPAAKARRLALAGLDRDRGLTGAARERVTGRVALAAVADLGEQLGSSTRTQLSRAISDQD